MDLAISGLGLLGVQRLLLAADSVLDFIIHKKESRNLSFGHDSPRGRNWGLFRFFQHATRFFDNPLQPWEHRDVAVPSDPTDERVRELCSKLLVADDAELEPIIAELQKTLRDAYDQRRSALAVVEIKPKPAPKSGAFRYPIEK